MAMGVNFRDLAIAGLARQNTFNSEIPKFAILELLRFNPYIPESLNS